MKNYKAVLLTIGIVAGLFVLAQDKVNALASPSGVVFSFPITCAATATKISNGTPYNTLRCYNASTTPVYLDGSDSIATTTGYEISTAATAADTALSMDVTNPAYCIVAAGTQIIRCIGGQ
jgi:hypothetical protein